MIILRDFAPIAERLFRGWHTGYKEVSSQAQGFNTAISEKDKGIYRCILAGGKFNEARGIKGMKIFFELA